MSDMLSQDEINALLGVVNGSNADEADNAGTKDAEASGISNDSENTEDTEKINKNEDKFLTTEEKDVLGEMGNIAMGTSATTLFTILRNRVSITTPHVEVLTWKEIIKNYLRPCVGIRINYKLGFEGSNILILNDRDVKIISNLMMGGDGIVSEEEPINEIDLSAIGEAMNQMIGSSVTSLASLVDMKIDIETPKAFVMNFEDDELFKAININPEEWVVRISFRMVVGDIIDSQIMQVYPLDFAKEVVRIMKKGYNADSGNQKEQKTKVEEAIIEPKKSIPKPTVAKNAEHKSAEPSRVNQNVNVAAVQFQDFDINDLNQQKENIDIIMDVPLEVTVELGRTRKRIKEILEFSPGTIVELDKIAGEPIDVLVNGRFIAKGEVVVIDENFGIRIVDIVSSENRI